MRWDRYKSDIVREINPEGLPPGKQYKRVAKWWDDELQGFRYNFELEDIPMSSSSGTRQGAKFAPRGLPKKRPALKVDSRWQKEMVSHLKKVRAREGLGVSQKRMQKSMSKTKAKAKEGVTTGQQWRKYGTLTLKLAPSEIKKIKRSLGI